LPIYELKSFARFARGENIADDALAKAVPRAARGLVDADLVGGLIKQRVARPGQGRRGGGHRVIIAFRSGDFAVFLFGFAKSAEDNLDDRQVKVLRGVDRLMAFSRRRDDQEGRATRRTRGGARMTKDTKQAFDDRFTREMTETIGGMRKIGVMDDPTYKLTIRDLKRGAPEETVFPLTGSEIRALRESAKLSQAVFRYLHLTVDHVSKLERGAKRPTGPALVLLNVIRRKGIKAIL
jgi:putative transcriptional regulator